MINEQGESLNTQYKTPVYWVFELGEDGTVLYSRSRTSGSAGNSLDLEGRNFFEEPNGFENISAYRQHFHSFVNSKKAAASFVWRRASDDGAINTKVLMTRAYQTGYCRPTGVVMMEIKSC